MVRSVSSEYFEALQQDGVQICELIELTSRTQTWRWGTSNKTIVSSTYDYLPFPGQTGQGIEESTDMGIATIGFVMANSGGAFNELLNSNNMDNADIVIRRVLTNSPDLDSMEIYRGKLGDYSFNRDTISGQARNEFGGINIKFPYYTYMDQCTWRFGSAGCGFDTTTITVSGDLLNSTSGDLNVQCISGTLVDSGYANGHFDKGKLTIVSGQNSGEVRTVRQHTGDLLSLSHGLPYSISSGDQFNLYRGCKKRLVQDCHSVFNNSSNFLGFPWIPRQEDAY